ncbi:hypothetical protein LOZ39_003125 [Ophidiomyces ophidiicola]|nr:hypothetical protein LOZ60_004259 [Ophidiomyces ophidiicola]KAI2005759.1 hypothetical protein LOZ49_005284 [Ophidiomyces ophidiicola]KAI2067104.1 hypothetical protein LOZ40_003224 [Ophidiomyces ophidiicola]KAI2075818.1 hypothetical protein LOZ39_003125 [Ophidiomyces ophidiicola]KAI2139402.1 hypothetical protein LOZ28_003252 [Ophidiomyces ophidiicola]
MDWLLLAILVSVEDTPCFDGLYMPFASSDNCPRIKACHFLLEACLSESGESALKTITQGGHLEDFIEDSRFTSIHWIVLGLRLLDLNTEVELHPEDLNAPYSMGRTLLAWAAACGDSHTIVVLLSHGADPNITDTQLSGPIFNAAARGHTVCVCLLLEAGGDPDPPLPSGSLLDFGANVNSRGSDGQTALIHASWADNSSTAMLLLDYGADINALSDTSSSPLTTAITYNSHNVLWLILDRWHEYTSCPRLEGPNILQLVAAYADIKTITILASAEHFRLKYDKHYALGAFRDRLLQRCDINEKLISAFDNLLDVISHIPDVRESPESNLEAGFHSQSSLPVQLEVYIPFQSLTRVFVRCFEARDARCGDSDTQSLDDDVSNDSFKDVFEEHQP